MHTPALEPPPPTPKTCTMMMYQQWLSALSMHRNGACRVASRCSTTSERCALTRILRVNSSVSGFNMNKRTLMTACSLWRSTGNRASPGAAAQRWLDRLLQFERTAGAEHRLPGAWEGIRLRGRLRC